MESASTSNGARTMIAAAASGEPAAGDPPPAPRPIDPRDRRFRLRAGETVPDGVRRVARVQLSEGRDAFASVADGELGEALHATRKRIKRVRAALRLARGAIDDSLYERENAHLRTIAGRLADARDARVLLETLTALERRFEDELPAGATMTLRARLQSDHERALAALTGQSESDVPAVTAQALDEAAARTAQWTFDDEGFAALRPGLRRIYRRGRKRLRAARAQPSAENLHDLRKRVKDLWHAAQLLRPAHPARMKRLSRRAHKLADLLGDHHDLSVLRDYIEVNRQRFSDAAARDALLAVLDRRRDAQLRRALKLGRRVYKQPPKRFVRVVRRGWRKRVGTATSRALAG